MIFTIYSLATGQIEKIVSSSNDELAIHFDSKISGCIEGQYSDIEFYIKDKKPVKILASPSEHHTFDFVQKKWVDTRTTEDQWEEVRYQRTKLLTKTDWTQLPDVPLDTKEAWSVYRQSLRDVTDQEDPLNIVWPTPPS
jgi:hypothetical protein